MSRIGNKVINLPAGVEVTNNDNVVTVKGPKGELTREFNKNIEIKVEGTEVSLHRPDDSKEMKTIHGTTRANLNNMVVGVSEGFKKELEMRGVGYRAQLQGSKLVLSVGKSHQDEVEAPEGVSFEVPSATTIVVNGINKEVVGPSAMDWDNEMSRARKNLDWEKMFSLAIDPEKARRYRAEAKPEKEDTCSMCGNFCAVKNMNRILDGEIVNIFEE